MTAELCEWQLVRKDGTVIQSLVYADSFHWEPAPGMAPEGECATRFRDLPDGLWQQGIYLPDGWRGPALRPWPEGFMISKRAPDPA